MVLPQKYPIGHTIEKEFEGYGFFEGTVKAFNSSTGLYKIQYPDGDVEDFDDKDMTRYSKKQGDNDTDYEEEEESEEESVSASSKQSKQRNAFSTADKKLAWDMANKYRKEGSKAVNHATFIPALAKAISQSEDYAMRLYANACMWAQKNKKRAANGAGSPTTTRKKARSLAPSVTLKGALSTNSFCNVHIIRGIVESKSNDLEKFELVRNLEGEKEKENDEAKEGDGANEGAQQTFTGIFHTADFGEEVFLDFQARSKLGVLTGAFDISGEGVSQKDGCFSITGTATPVEGTEPVVYDLVMQKEYQSTPTETWQEKLWNMFKKQQAEVEAMKKKEAEALKEAKKKEAEASKEANKETDQFKNDMLEITGKIKKEKFAWPFLKPVDLEEVPDYLDTVKTPIDLSTIEERIQNGDHYKTKKLLQADLMLMVGNCKLYNGDEPDGDYMKCAKSLEMFLGTLSFD